MQLHGSQSSWRGRDTCRHAPSATRPGRRPTAIKSSSVSVVPMASMHAASPAVTASLLRPVRSAGRASAAAAASTSHSGKKFAADVAAAPRRRSSGPAPPAPSAARQAGRPRGRPREAPHACLSPAPADAAAQQGGRTWDRPRCARRAAEACSARLRRARLGIAKLRCAGQGAHLRGPNRTGLAVCAVDLPA